MCNCVGGYSGNDCGTRLCPKGDDPLTHEVENAGDGRASQQSEVQTVTFNAGRGLGGTATLTYNDLYGQSWTTRPFNVGGDNVYRLEVSVAPGTAVLAANHKHKIIFTYNGVDSATDDNGLAIHLDKTATNGGYAAGTSTLTAATIRDALLPLFGAYQTNAYVEKDRGNTIYVRKHHSATSVKLGGSIHANTRLTYDIHIPIDMSGHDDNGALASAFTVAWDATPDANTAELKLYQLGDRSAEIESALTSLPNQVIPSVTVNKVGVTDSDTNSDGANGNAYAQSYAITFNNEANSGDQNMLTCNASPCDENGCINRGPGVSEVRYMRHDPEKAGEGINFVNQGYFVMDIGSDAYSTDLSAGSIKIMWDTGAGIDSAIFAVVATAAEVQTALRTITGWEAVTVELWGSRKASGANADLKLIKNHQLKVTFAAGYDDLGKSPTFYTMLNTDGAYATASPDTARARLYDQRFSNSIWLGKLTGYVECKEPNAGTTTCNLQTTDINGNERAVSALASNGDIWVTSGIFFGVGGVGTDAGDPAGSGAEIELFKASAMDDDIVASNIGFTQNKIGFAYLKEGKISVQTSDYFAVGSTVEVLGTTWDDTNVDADVAASDVGYNSNNAYRKFKVTGHVTNEFNREFAKLDSFPADDGITTATTNAYKPDYNLKITSNNGTVRSYPAGATTDFKPKITVNEIQVITIDEGGDDDNINQIWKLYYKGEESQNMDHASTIAQVAEEINGFSALSGPVTVAKEGSTAGAGTATGAPRYVVTFDAKDGDVAQMTAVTNSGTGTVKVSTRANGWSIEGPVGLGMDTMQAGGIINVTANEICSFAFSGALTSGYFCYAGNCGPAVASDGAAANDFRDAVRGITDDTGIAILGTATSTGKSDTSPIAVTLPIGVSCDHLELRGNDVAVVKSVDKNNNGKQFKITRSFLQKTAVPTITSTTLITCTVGTCHDAVEAVDSIIIGGAGCGVAHTTDDGSYPIHRDAGTVTYGAATTIAVATLGADTECNSQYLGRHVITLNSMPTSSGVAVEKRLLYTSPVGSCSVAETTKGTYESYECSNRGACDGKSGLCTCYEGYSGQSCQTQTVLV
jgi:hypothetical protein